MKKCPTCGSIWVCWNWIHTTREDMQELNPDKVFTGDQWYHECWDCSDVFTTQDKELNGIEYERLVRLYPNEEESKSNV